MGSKRKWGRSGLNPRCTTEVAQRNLGAKDIERVKAYRAA